MTITELKNQLKIGNVENLYLFYGEEEYLIYQYIDRLKNMVISEGTLELNYYDYISPAALDDVRNACDSAPMFSEKKLVIWRNPGIFKKAGEGSGKGDDALLELIENNPEYSCLVMIEEGIDKRRKRLLSAIESKGKIVEFPFQQPEDLVKWITAVLADRNRRIERKAAYLLVEYGDQGMGGMVNELDKLTALTEDTGMVRVEDVESVCIKSLKLRIFDLVDAVAYRRGDRALTILSEMLQQREPVSKLLFMISKQFRQMYETQVLKQKGEDKRRIAEILKVPPFVASKLIDQSKPFSIDALEKVLKLCLETELNIKTGRMGDRTAIELLIANIILDIK
ncbi:MAG: DNA polymerase III subunit delta [Eubacteriales bacterium]|nr:DNA polymerase III subunit delta [Eubacteriales bacterium]